MGDLVLVVTVGIYIPRVDLQYGNKSFEWHNEQLGFKNADINKFEIHN